jgi:hypothetical protein
MVYVCPHCGRWQNFAVGAAMRNLLFSVIKALGGESSVPVQSICSFCKTELLLADPTDRFLFLSRTVASDRLPDGSTDRVRTTLMEVETEAQERYLKAHEVHLQYEQEHGSFLERGEHMLTWLPHMTQPDWRPLSQKECQEAIRFIGQVLYLLYLYSDTPSPHYEGDEGRKVVDS